MNKQTDSISEAIVNHDLAIRQVERSAITLFLVRNLPTRRAVTVGELEQLCDRIQRGDHLALLEPVTGIDHGRD